MARPTRAHSTILAFGLLVAACSSGSASAPLPFTPTAAISAAPAPATHATEPSAAATTAVSPLATSSLTSATGWLAYQACTGCASFLDDDIYLIHADGSDNHEILTDIPGRRAHPDFSRDGTMLTFDNIADEQGSDATWIAKADGSGARLITPCKPPDCLGVWEPSWSPDGRSLAVATAGGPLVSDAPSSDGIAVVDVATGKRTQLVDHNASDGQDHFPRWSPDGKRLAFWRGRVATAGSPESAIFIVDVGGGEPRQLTDWNDVASDPDWSPDGGKILYTTHPLVDFPDSGRSDLFTMTPDGSDQQALTEHGAQGPRATQPRWSPDGSAILYTRTTQSGQPRTIWSMAADGTNDVSLIDRFATHPILQPTP